MDQRSTIADYFDLFDRAEIVTASTLSIAILGVRGEVDAREIREEMGLSMTGKKASGRLMREIRDHLELTQADMAERLGTAQQRISAWERGKRVPSNAYRQLIQRLVDDHREDDT